MVDLSAQVADVNDITNNLADLIVSTAARSATSATSDQQGLQVTNYIVFIKKIQ